MNGMGGIPLTKWEISIPYKSAGYTGTELYALGKNLLSESFPDKIAYNVTFTTNDDGSVTTSGTNSSASAAASSQTARFKLPIGSFVMSGCPFGGGNSKYFLRVLVYNGSNFVTSYTDTGAGVSFSNANAEYEYTVLINVLKTQTAPTAKWYPMIRVADDTPDFEKHIGQSFDISWTATAGTIYGGSLNVGNGVLTSEYSSSGSAITPVTYTIPGTVVRTVQEINNIWSDAGTSSVSYSTKWANAADTLVTDAYDAVSIPSNSDFNDYKTAGNYRVNTSAIATTISNMPLSAPGRLIVMTTYHYSVAYQIFIASTGRAYSRILFNGSWSAWLNGFNNTVELDYNSTTVISANSDMDSYQSTGNYYVKSAADAATISHIPDITNGGRLIVFTQMSTTQQLYICANGKIYIRRIVGTGFAAWDEVVFVTDKYKDLMNDRYAKMGKGLNNFAKALIKQGTYDISFANAPAPINLYNYAGNTENIHPKVLYFEDGFGGHNYWMAYTPYPNSLSRYENPCIAYSDDGYTWSNIAGNPLDNPNQVGYDSDTHLVYRSDTSTLECWYRYVNTSASPNTETIYRQTSTDGITWSAKEQVIVNSTGTVSKYLSPTVIFDGTNYNIWVVDSTTITYYTAPASNVSNWSKVRTYSIAFSDGGTSVNPWHLDVIMDSGNYVMCVMCRDSSSITDSSKWSLFITTSSNNTTYSTPVKVIGGSDNWDSHLYRSSIVKVGSTYRIYYSAVKQAGTTYVWGTGVSESDSLTTGYIGIIA